MLSGVDDTGKARAAAAVEDAMYAAHLNPQGLADLAGIHVDTVRDFITSRGGRWPRGSKQRAIEGALKWEPGRIAALARDFSEVPDKAHSPVSVEPQLILDLTSLTHANQLRAWAAIKELLEEQRQRDDGDRNRAV